MNPENDAANCKVAGLYHTLGQSDRARNMLLRRYDLILLTLGINSVMLKFCKPFTAITKAVIFTNGLLLQSQIILIIAIVSPIANWKRNEHQMLLPRIVKLKAGRKPDTLGGCRSPRIVSWTMPELKKGHADWFWLPMKKKYYYELATHGENGQPDSGRHLS